MCMYDYGKEDAIAEYGRAAAAKLNMALLRADLGEGNKCYRV